MTGANSFLDARIELRGQVGGVDGEPHQLFKIIRSNGSELWGDYFEISEGLEDYNLEIGEFGYVNPRYLGGEAEFRQKHRQQFSAEECAVVEELIHSLFSKPDVFKGKYLRGEFLGGLRFRTDWISGTR